jgi:phage N-6-adenine-methyltransferase
VTALSVSRGHSADPSAIKRRWRTPRDLFDSLAMEFPFGLDAAAEPGANLCERYIAPPGELRFGGRGLAMAQDCLTTDWSTVCPPREDGTPGWAFANFPWGARYTACRPGCRKDHVHHADSFPGTGAFVDAALVNAARGLGVVLLLPTDVTSSWWKRAWRGSQQTRITDKRIAFLDPDTGRAMGQPPAGGCSIFVMRGPQPVFPGPIVLADALGRTS